MVEDDDAGQTIGQDDLGLMLVTTVGCENGYPKDAGHAARAR